MNQLTDWLNNSDPFIKYLYTRDILNASTDSLNLIQKEMLVSGWGYELMSHQKSDGYWQGYYSPKWTSTHYTLQTLRCLNYPRTDSIDYAIQRILKEEKCKDGGISPSNTKLLSDCCVNGMFLAIACYFHANPEDIKSMIDYLIHAQLKDGGFNCRFNRTKAHHSAFNTTLCVLEGLWEYEVQGYKYRLDEVKKIRKEAEEFLLIHQLYISDKTGKIIDERYCSMHFPYYWRYDLLRALEYFAMTDHAYDQRLNKALDWLQFKQKNDRFKLSAQYSGLSYLSMEKAGKESKINTVRALKVLKTFNRL